MWAGFPGGTLIHDRLIGKSSDIGQIAPVFQPQVRSIPWNTGSEPTTRQSPTWLHIQVDQHQADFAFLWLHFCASFTVKTDRDSVIQ